MLRADAAPDPGAVSGTGLRAPTVEDASRARKWAGLTLGGWRGER
jgi:hypothetical protein